MAFLRLCSHIKTNGQKCGSPALRHHTHCYFHYQWQRRDQRRIRLGGPIGMGKNSSIELPLLDGPEAILVSIMEIQHALLDQRIPIKMGTALLYSLQLALQAKISYFGLCHREPVRECPELDMELEIERAKSLRPATEKCAACPKQETCLSPRGCRKLPKPPSGYHREGDRIVPDHVEREHPEVGAPFKPSVGLSGAVSSDTTMSSSRAESRSDAVEGPASLPTEAPTLTSTSTPEKHTPPLRESSPGREPGVADQKFPPSRAHARRQIDATETDAIPNANNILGFKTNALIDLPRKFPQLAETKKGEN